MSTIVGAVVSCCESIKKFKVRDSSVDHTDGQMWVMTLLDQKAACSLDLILGRYGLTGVPICEQITMSAVCNLQSA